jgi:hypothetical protein
MSGIIYLDEKGYNDALQLFNLKALSLDAQ